MRLLPTRRALALAGLWLMASVLAMFGWIDAAAAAYAGVLLFAALALEAYGLLRQPLPQGRREAPHSLAAGRWHDIVLVTANDAPRSAALRIYDLHPESFECRDLPAALALPARGWVRTTYAVRSSKRGAFEFGAIEIRLRSRFGLLERQARIGAPQAVRVYPDFGALTGYALLATDHRLSQLGVLQRRRRGEGLDFHQLREYRVGDSVRRIDWKATARMHRLISREYQDERDQAIVMLLDCGRRMAAADGEVSHFDAALNAALLLAHVGLHHGDAVGVLTMAGEQRFIAPRKARSTITLMLNMLYDLQPTLRPPDYHAAALDLMQRVRKRALVVVLSNLRDEDDDTLRPALDLMRRRHLVLFASLREQVLARTLSASVRDLDGALTHAATADYLQARNASFAKLQRAGALMLDVEPQQLALALVNRYLDIKRSGTL
ncbi:MAG: DUF58 domain-containing protein [Burkholderiales bacterium]|nr:DUF58 domain-containing protein [Burkholderiales bacterium]